MKILATIANIIIKNDIVSVNFTSPIYISKLGKAKIKYIIRLFKNKKSDLCLPSLSKCWNK